jgi:CRP/FNR family transcriptional regulator, cyclic AMP receptor protein
MVASMDTPKTSTIAVVRKVPLFSDLTDQEFADLEARIVVRHYDSAEMIFSEGDPCDGLFVVQSGHVRIFKSSANGREQVLSIDGPGSSIAELPVFDGGPYPASGVALSTLTLLFLSKQDFRAFCLKYPEVSLKVLRVVGGRLRRLVGIIEELSFTTVRHRLVALLLRLAKTEGVRSANGVTITLPAHNQELAAQIGTVRELVSRNMSRLQQENLIEIDGRTVVLRDPAALVRLLEEAG